MKNFKAFQADLVIQADFVPRNNGFEGKSGIVTRKVSFLIPQSG